MPLTPSVTVTLLMAEIGVLSAETAKAGSVPDGYRQVWSDEFASLSLLRAARLMTASKRAPGLGQRPAHGGTPIRRA